MECTEPDLEFIFHSKHEEADYIKYRYELADRCLTIIIHLLDDGAVSPNSIRLTFFREDAEHLCTYLRYVTKEIDKKSPEIITLVEQGVLTDTYR